jgi:hypothetical protein
MQFVLKLGAFTLRIAAFLTLQTTCGFEERRRIVICYGSIDQMVSLGQDDE